MKKSIFFIKTRNLTKKSRNFGLKQETTLCSIKQYYYAQGRFINHRLIYFSTNSLECNRKSCKEQKKTVLETYCLHILNLISFKEYSN